MDLFPREFCHGDADRNELVHFHIYCLVDAELTHCNQLWRSWPCPELTGFSRCHSCSLQADVPETWSQASGGLPAGGALAPSEQACAGACAAASPRVRQTVTLRLGVPLINFLASTGHDIHSFNDSKNKCISLYLHSALAFYLF